MDNYVLGWLISGVILILLEFAVPGAILSFLGIASILVATLMYYGYIDGIVEIMITWFITSLFLVIFVRALFLRIMPGASEVEGTDELKDALGGEVEVITEISKNGMGRVRYRDTTWDAMSESQLLVGARAKIVGKSGNRWIVE